VSSRALCLRKGSLQIPEIWDHINARRRDLRHDLNAEEREIVNDQCREQYALDSTLQTPREREQTNAQCREHDAQMRAQQDPEVRVQCNARRRDQYAQQPAEECAQVNDGRRETYVEHRARNLKKNRSNFSRDPEASLDDIKLHSVGELCFACRKCEVRLYKGERTAAGNTFSFHCAQGQV